MTGGAHDGDSFSIIVFTVFRMAHLFSNSISKHRTTLVTANAPTQTNPVMASPILFAVSPRSAARQCQL